MSRLKKSVVQGRKPDLTKDIRLWDDDPRGFGVRIKPSGVKSFFYQFRSPVTYKKARITISQYGVMTIDEARDKAKDYAKAVRDGVDPLKQRERGRTEARLKARTVREFCQLYLEDAKAGKVRYRGLPKKASTISIDEGRIRRHIVPLLGDKLIQDVTPADIIRFVESVREGKTAVTEKTGWRGMARVTGGAVAADRALGLLGSIFTYAIKKGLVDSSPVKGIEREPNKRRTRVLSPGEYRTLGKAIEAADHDGHRKPPLLAVLVLALTGCRRNEVFSLTPPTVDLHNQCFRFEDTKTGQQTRPIGKAACEVLGDALDLWGGKYVFPGASGNTHLTDVKFFGRLCDRAELKNVTLNTLRHSFATVALELGYSEPIVGGLLGHRRHSVTSGYTHLVDRALVEVADRVSSVIASRLEGREGESGTVVSLRKA